MLAAPNAQLVFDSRKIPGEIIDLMVVNTATLTAYPQLGKALVGAWYETMALMLRHDAAAQAALASMAKASGTDPAGFDSQLATTHLFAAPAEAYAFMTGDAIIKTMDLVRRFSYEHGILGRGRRFSGRRGNSVSRRKVTGRCGQYEDALRPARSRSWPWTGGCSGIVVRRLVNRYPTRAARSF